MILSGGHGCSGDAHDDDHSDHCDVECDEHGEEDPYKFPEASLRIECGFEILTRLAGHELSDPTSVFPQFDGWEEVE